jgi:hypothetical protein
VRNIAWSCAISIEAAMPLPDTSPSMKYNRLPPPIPRAPERLWSLNAVDCGTCRRTRRQKRLLTEFNSEIRCGGSVLWPNASSAWLNGIGVDSFKCQLFLNVLKRALHHWVHWLHSLWRTGIRLLR